MQPVRAGRSEYRESTAVWVLDGSDADEGRPRHRAARHADPRHRLRLSLDFSVTVTEGRRAGTLFDETFTSVADAQNFFTDHALDLGGLASATPDVTVQVTFDLFHQLAGLGLRRRLSSGQ